MFDRISLVRSLWLTTISILFAFCATAQVQVTFPSERAIFQRQPDGKTKVPVSGSYTTETDKIEVRAVPVKAGQGKEVGWTTLEDHPQGGVFNGALELSGGWYMLEIRGSVGGKIIGTDTVSKMGVGEVFIISGQSNAQGVDLLKQFPLPPGASDDRVNYISYNNEDQNSLNDPPPAVFEQLQLQDSVHILGPIGRTAWCWGILGDLLAKKLNVPVLFINTAWSGTSILNWLLSSQNLPTTSIYSDSYYFPNQMPYGNLRLAVQNYASQYGARAVLWMLGESDNYPVKMGFDDFKNDLEFVIRKLGSDTNTKLPWIISKTSRIADATGTSVTSAEIIAAQNAVIQDLSGVTFSGPETDDLPVTRVDGTHFYGTEALTVLANAWDKVLSETFLKDVNPLIGNQIPKITINCEPTIGVATLSLPDQFDRYTWSVEQDGNITEQSGRSLTISSPGVYWAKVKDGFGNTIRAQRIEIKTPLKPVTPRLLQTGSLQVCADSSLVLHVEAGNDKYSWYLEGQADAVQTGDAFRVKQSGNFIVRSENVLGCISDDSSPASIVVQKEILKPDIAKIGPFDITLIPRETDGNASFVWKKDQQILLATRDTLQTDMAGLYSGRIAQTFQIEDGSLVCYSPYSDEILIDNDEVSDFVIFPNPAYGSDIYIESKDDIQQAEVSVYDISGKVLIFQKQDLGRRSKVPLQHLGAGRYIIRIKAAKTDVRKQIIVK